MSDLTVIYLTANKLPERFALTQREYLLQAAKGYRIITVSPIDIHFGDGWVVDMGKKSHANMYFQLLRAAQFVKTPYIATAEDDVFYAKEHFNFYRPPQDAVAYDMSRWSLFTWNPVYNLKQRVSNCMLIAPRDYLIAALEERFSKYNPDNFPPHLVSEIGRYEKNLGITPRNMVKVYAEVPSIQFNHPNGTDSTEQRKRMGQLKAHDIPFWGKAEELVKLYE